MKLNDADIKQFLKSLRGSDIEELSYEKGGTSIYFKKDLSEDVEVSNKKDAKKIQVLAPAIAQDKKASTKEENSTIKPIKSIMVGTFSTIQGDKPTITVGSKVKEGQKIGQIEAMKIIKDVHSNVKGKVVKVLVSHGESVEYGQELFLVDTQGDK